MMVFVTIFHHFWGPNFLGPGEIFGPGGVRKCRFLAIFGHFGGFRDPPKIRKFPENFSPVSLQLWGPKSGATPFLKSWRPSNATENRANFDFCAKVHFFAILGHFLGPILAIFGHFSHFWHIWGGSGPHLLGTRKKEIPFRVPPSPWEGPRIYVVGTTSNISVDMEK